MNRIKPTFKTETLPIIAVIMAIIASFYFYANFPEQVPIHWNMAGEVDNYGSRTTGAFLFPGIILGTYLLFFILPYLDPKKKRYLQFRKVYHIFKAFLVLFMAGLYFITGFNALGYNIPVQFWVPVLVGLLFIVIGNYLGKIKPNWFMGIRTPWTLSSEEVWNKTHRLGGKAFIIGGAMMMLTALVPVLWIRPLFISMIVIVALGPIAYSYILYAREQKIKKHDQDNQSA